MPPKDSLQCLTLEDVKALLRNGESVLDAALNAGLSGPGRLHDLCFTLDGASPGEMKSGDAGVEIRYGFVATPFVKRSSAKLCAASLIYRLSMVKVAMARDLLASHWPDAKLHRTDQRAKELSATIFAERQNQSRPKLRAFVRGTPSN